MSDITPPQRPRLKRDNALSLLGNPTLNPGEVIVGGIRGYYYSDSANNKRGIYDDAIVIIGPEHFSTYNANVDPSVHRSGIATLRPGIHPYRPGKHGISRPGGGYPAFRPATKNEALPVDRDGETDPRPGIAINIHKGGFTTTSSEGCQTIHPSQWPAFQATLMDQLKRSGQKAFEYHLVHPVG
jgi:lysozyme